MTKKTLKSNNPNEVRYALLEDSVSVEGTGFCCGLSEVSGLHSVDVPSCKRKDWKKCSWKEDSFEGDYPYKTREDCFNDWYKKMLAERYTTSVFLTLVTKYKEGVTNKGQFPEFYKWLVEKKKWKKMNEFINSNTGNKVVMLGKNFPPKQKPVQRLFGSTYF